VLVKERDGVLHRPDLDRIGLIAAVVVMTADGSYVERAKD